LGLLTQLARIKFSVRNFFSDGALKTYALLCPALYLVASFLNLKFLGFKNMWISNRCGHKRNEVRFARGAEQVSLGESEKIFNAETPGRPR
jgi:hypothetical protein